VRREFVHRRPRAQKRADEIDGRLRDWFAAQPLESARWSALPPQVFRCAVVSPSLVTDNPQLRDRGFFEE